MVLGKHFEGAVVFVLGHQVTRRLRHPVNEENLDSGGESLEDGGNSPGGISASEVGTERDPGHKESTHVPETIVDGGQPSTMLGMANLCQKHRGSELSKGISEAKHHTATHEGSKVVGSTLNNGTRNHDKTSDSNWDLAAHVVSEDRDEGNRDQATNLIEGTKETKHATLRVIELGFPGIEVLDGIEKHAIVTSGSGGNAENEGVEVQLPQARLPVPGDLLELRSFILGLGHTLYPVRILLLNGLQKARHGGGLQSGQL